MTEGDLCYWHEPSVAQERAAAQRLGGANRRRQVSLGTAYDFSGIHTIEDLNALTSTIIVDLLAMPSSIDRNRLLISILAPSARIVEKGDLAAPIAALEAIRLPDPDDKDGER